MKKTWLWTLAVFLLTSLPCFFLDYVWYRTNQGYPRDDSSEYAARALEIYSLLTTQGIRSALSFAWFAHGTKPTLLPVLNLPFLALTGGQTNAAVMLSAFFFLMVLLSHVFLIFLEFLPIASATLALLVFEMLPWVVGNSYRTMPYLPFAAFSVAAVFYFLKSNHFRILRFSILFGVCLGIATCIRPVEAVILFGVPIAGYSIWVFRRSS